MSSEELLHLKGRESEGNQKVGRIWGEYGVKETNKVSVSSKWSCGYMSYDVQWWSNFGKKK